MRSTTLSPARTVVLVQLGSLSVRESTYLGMVFMRSAKPSGSVAAGQWLAKMS